MATWPQAAHHPENLCIKLQRGLAFALLADDPLFICAVVLDRTQYCADGGQGSLRLTGPWQCDVWILMGG